MSRPEAPSDPPLRTVQLPSGALAYTDEGTGEPVLAVHGMPGSNRDWRWLAAALDGRVRLIRLDLPGFGETPLATSRAVSLADRARFVLEVADALELKRFAILGHSIGGPLALTVAAEATDRVTALGLIASVGLSTHRGFKRMGPGRKMAPLLDARLTRPLMMPLARALFARWGFRGYTDEALRQTMRVVGATDVSTHRALAARVTAPTLVVTAAADPIIEPAIGDELAAALPADGVVAFPDSGHFVQKPYANEIAEALVALLARD